MINDMTEKLFYQDAYCKTFTAAVTGCAPREGGYAVTLDRTAFYPEGGGQPSDTGTLGGVRVCGVHEKDGEIVHYTDGPLTLGDLVTGEIDWARRFGFMQHHTGEHIVSGILHRLYGLDNVGFHMGHDAVTIDLNGELNAEQLRKAELLANESIYADLPVEVSYPSPTELETLPYRSKKELSGRVRIVTIPGSDICACCGTHCARTGEVGILKLISSQRYKGGLRVWLLCGERAVNDYEEKLSTVSRIAAMLSVKPAEAYDAVVRLSDELSARKQEFSALQEQLFMLKADRLAGPENLVVFEENCTPGELRRFCLILSERCGGFAAVLSGNETDGWKYALGSKSQDVRVLCKKLNGAFSGRGGGTAVLAQGSLQGCGEAIESFLRT